MPENPTPSTPESTGVAAKKRRLSLVTPHSMLRLNSKRKSSPLVGIGNISSGSGKSAGTLRGNQSKMGGILAKKYSNSNVNASTQGGDSVTTGNPKEKQTTEGAADQASKGKEKDNLDRSKAQTNNEDEDDEKNNNDEDDEDMNDANDGRGDHNYQLIKQSRDEIRRMLDGFTEEQRERYDIYRRAALSKSTVKKLASQILNQPVSPTLVFVIAGFSKVFVGEVIEQAKEIMRERGDEGGIAPDHLREAYRRIRNRPEYPRSGSFEKRLF